MRRGPGFRLPEEAVEPGFDGLAEGLEEAEGGVPEAEADDGEEHGKGDLDEPDLGTGLVGPGGGQLEDAEAPFAEEEKEVDVKGHVGDVEAGFDGADGGGAKDFGAALGVADAEVEEGFDNKMEDPAGGAAPVGLEAEDSRAWEPPGTDGGIGAAAGAGFEEFPERLRRRGAVGVDVPHKLGFVRLAEPLHEGAALADGVREFDPADGGMALGGFADDLKRFVAAAVEDDGDGVGARQALAEEGGVGAEDGADALGLVVGGDQEQQPRVHSGEVCSGLVGKGKDGDGAAAPPPPSWGCKSRPRSIRLWLAGRGHAGEVSKCGTDPHCARARLFPGRPYAGRDEEVHIPADRAAVE